MAPQEDVDALVLADESESEQTGSGPAVARARRGLRREGAGAARPRTPDGRRGRAPTRAWSAPCTSDRVDPREEHRHEGGVATSRLVRQDVVAHDHRLWSRTGRARDRAGGPEQHEVGGDDRGHHVDDEDGVDVAQPPSGAHPGVGASPAERADRPREGGHLRLAVGRRRVRVVQPGGVEVRPRDQRHVVPGLHQVVGQHRRVRRDPALVRVGRTDDGDAQRGRSRRVVRPGRALEVAEAPAVPADRWPRTGEPCGNASVMVLRLSSRRMPLGVLPSRPRVSGRVDGVSTGVDACRRMPAMLWTPAPPLRWGA